MRALILEDGLSRQALTASRALAAAGWEVGVGSELPRGVAAWSRSTLHDHRVPSAERDPDGFVDGVNAAISQVGYELVFGARDVELLALSSRRDHIDAEVPHPPHDRVLRAVDKLELSAAAQRVGMASPRTVPACDDALAGVTGPTIVKARLHATLEGAAGPPRLDTVLCADRAQAARRAREIRSAGGEPLLQDVLPGRLEAVAIVADRDGSIVARVHQVALRTSLQSAGVAVRAVTIRPDERLMEQVAALIAELGWWGLAELQFIVAPGGDPHLIDFNGRFYGSLALAVGAGVNLPALWGAVATDRQVEWASAKEGVRYQWLLGDLRSCLAEPRRDRARALVESARWAPRACQSVFSASDPMPALRHLQIDLRQVSERRLARIRERARA